MSQLLEILGGPFSSDGFVPQRFCGLWSDWLVWEHVAGHALVWLAYDAVPVLIRRSMITRDISRRKRAEECLRDSEARLRAIVESAVDGIVTIDERGAIESVNAATLRIFGYEEGELLGQSVSVLMPPPHRDEHDRYVAEYVRTGRRKIIGVGHEAVGRRKDGGTFPVDISVSEVLLGRRRLFTGIIRDITARKHAEDQVRLLNETLEHRVRQRTAELVEANAALRDSERRFRALFDSAFQFIALLSPDGTVLEANRTALDFCGLTRDEVRGRPFWEPRWWARSGEVQDWLKRAVREAAAGRLVRDEAVHRGAGDVAATVDFSLKPITDEAGRVILLIAEGRDITERKRAEQELKEQAQLLDLAHDTILACDLQARITFWNKGAERMYGWSREEAVGRVSHDLLKTQFPIPLAQIEAELADRGYWEGELIHRRRDGTPVVAASRWVLQRDDRGEPRAYLEMNNDITQKSRAERERERLAAIVESSHDAIIGETLEGVITSWNRGAEQLFGYAAGEVLGRHISVLVPPTCTEDIARVLDRIRRGEPVDHYETRRRTKDGQVIDVSLSASPIRDAAGAIVGASKIARDISERKRMEGQLDQKTRELARSNAELEQFAYVASHDLQEPLRMVSSFTQLLAHRYQGQLDAAADEYIHYAVDGCNRMQRLIQDLLTYSRVGTRGKPPQSVDCEEVLASVLAGMRMALEESGAEVTHDPLPTVAADPIQLGQLFQNLVGNAIKFRGPDPPRVHVSAAHTAEGWEFSVRDNGIGIDPKYFERVFVMFQRLHTRDEYPGTGIGLAVCKKIVERHGGRIWVESAPGRGSRFVFTIPERIVP